MGASRDLLTGVGVSLDMLLAALAGSLFLLVDRQVVAPRGPAYVEILLPERSIEDHAAMGRIWGVESPYDADYVLDVAALQYLPTDSTVRHVGRMIYWCGTPLGRYYSEAIPERYLLLRAIRLQRLYAPEEAERGPYVVEAACSTPGCAGRVPILRHM